VRTMTNIKSMTVQNTIGELSDSDDLTAVATANRRTRAEKRSRERETHCAGGFGCAQGRARRWTSSSRAEGLGRSQLPWQMELGWALGIEGAAGSSAGEPAKQREQGALPGRWAPSSRAGAPRRAGNLARARLWLGASSGSRHGRA
jgi:hypothetical protein